MKFVKISGIKKLEEKAKVVDIECSPYHNFVSNYMVVHNCAFCANALLRKIKGEPYVRKRNVDKCITELKHVVPKYNVKVVNFADDEFTLKHDWVYEFLEKYKKQILDKYGCKFVIESRVDTITEPIAKALKESGCREIQFGVESGSERILDFLNKNINHKKIKNAFRICDKYHINTYVYMMLGIPTETVDDLNDTMKLLADIKPRLIRPTFLCPVKGTAIYDYCVKHKLMSKDVAVWNFESPLKLKAISNELLMKYWFLYPWIVNMYMGYDDYSMKVYRYMKKDFNADVFDSLLDEDKDIDKEYRYKKLPHYVYKTERKKGDRKFRFNRLELIR